MMWGGAMINRQERLIVPRVLHDPQRVRALLMRKTLGWTFNPGASSAMRAEKWMRACLRYQLSKILAADCR